jgi:hypothetical protein
MNQIFDRTGQNQPSGNSTHHPLKADDINILGLESPKYSTELAQLCRNSRWF